MERDPRQRSRRRARAQRMKAVGEKKRENGNETGDEEVAVREKPPRPIHRQRKICEPLYEEDIIDGFAIASFKSYNDLEVSYFAVLSAVDMFLSICPLHCYPICVAFILL